MRVSVYCDDLPSPRPRLDAPARRAVDGLLAGELIVVLIDVALFEILEAEIGAEEAGGAVLQRDAAVAADRRGPHPLVGGAVGVIDDEQRDAFHFGGRREADDRLCCCRTSRCAATATISSRLCCCRR